MNARSAPSLLVLVSVWLAFFAIVAYAVYSVESGTGPGGWLIAFEVQNFGDAFPALSIALILLLLGVSAGLLALLLRRLYSGPRGNPPVAPARPVLGDGDSPRMFMAVGIAIMICGVIVGAGGTLYLHWKNEAARGKAFEPVRLRLDVPVAAHGTYLELAAKVQQRYTYTVTRTGRGWKRADYYLLLTAPEWQRDNPVTHVLVLTGRPLNMNFAEISSPLYVEAERGGLPLFLLNYYKKAGITLADPHYAVTPMPVEDGRVGARENEETASLIVGLIFAVMGAAFAGWGYRMSRKTP